MTSIIIGIVVLILTFASGAAGLYLQKLLPQQHMTGGSRDMILAVIGLVTLLVALVLGTLVGNTYAFYASQKSGLETFASRALQVDRALAKFGPEAKTQRDRFKEALTESYELFWRRGNADPKQLGLEAALNHWEPIEDLFLSLNPTTPAQKEALAAANANIELMVQTRTMVSLQLVSPISTNLLIVVVAWSMFLFCGFGVLSGTNSTTLAVLALGSLSVASAVYLILDLSEPYSGLFRVSPAAIQQTIAVIDR